MFSLFKRKSAAPTELTFKARISQFWQWYGEVAERFLQTIDDGRCADLRDEINAKISELNPEFAWVFGPGEEGIGHSLTVSGEANPHRQLLAAYWRNQAPKLPGWSFYATRQPSKEVGTSHIHIGTLDFDPAAFWLTPSVREDEEKIALTVWHPLFPQLDENQRWMILFLFLDEALGELGTQNWIGEVHMDDKHFTGAVPLKELPAFVQTVIVEKGWEKGEPGEMWTTYQMKEPHDRFPRSDVRVGITCFSQLIDDYYEADGDLADPLGGTGADYAYVALPMSRLPRGGELDARQEIAEALDAALERDASGRMLGGATGYHKMYIDLLLFDGPTSLAVVQRVLRDRRITEGTSIEWFARERHDQRIVL